MSQRHAHHVAATGHKDLARAFNFRALTSEERALARQDQSATINDVPESVEIAATGSRLSIHITAINSAQNQHTGHLVLPKPIEPIYLRRQLEAWLPATLLPFSLSCGGGKGRGGDNLQ